MFFLKKLVSQIFYPVPALSIVLLVLVIVTLRGNSETIVKAGTTLFFLLFLLLSFFAFPDAITKKLEHQNSTLFSPPKDISTVVVLGGGSCADADLPVSGQLSSASLIRLVEGIVQFNQLDSARLIVTGGAIFDTTSIAEIQRRMAIKLGVDSTKIDMANQADDTETEAIHVREIVGDDRIILVTSATHMSRALALFKKVGFEPIPAPTNHLVPNRPVTPSRLFPSANNLYNLKKSVHEILGTLWSRARGRI